MAGIVWWVLTLAASSLLHGAHGKKPVRLSPANCRKLEPDVFRDTIELISSKGYPAEKHYVQTHDGYILTLHRIPHGIKSSAEGPRPVVFLQHGLLGDSSNWVTNAADQSLGYILADQGFDVWMGNVRGNMYSKNHATLKPNQKQFWEFSWADMARFDLPAMIGFALETTGQSNLSYIGHSQGTLIGFYGFSSNSDLAKKVNLFMALAPVYTVGHMGKSVQNLLKYVVPSVKFLAEAFGHNEFLPGTMIKWLVQHGACSGKWKETVCYTLAEELFGFDDEQNNKTRVPVYMSHFPSGTSVRNIAHFLQLVKTKNCQLYDYGSAKENMEHYSQTSPPLCHVETMPVPVAIFLAEHDAISDVTDVKMLLPKLKTLVKVMDIKEWNHADFLWALDAPKILYPEMIQLLKSYSQ